MPAATDAQSDLIALLKATAPTDWPRIWSAVYGHREAAVAAVLHELEAALTAPEATRQSVMRHVRQAAREVVERGPACELPEPVPAPPGVPASRAYRDRAGNC